MKLLGLDAAVRFGCAGLAFEQFVGLFRELALPVLNLVWVNVELLGEFGDGLPS